MQLYRCIAHESDITQVRALPGSKFITASSDCTLLRYLIITLPEPYPYTTLSLSQPNDLTLPEPYLYTTLSLSQPNDLTLPVPILTLPVPIYPLALWHWTDRPILLAR